MVFVFTASEETSSLRERIIYFLESSLPMPCKLLFPVAGPKETVVTLEPLFDVKRVLRPHLKV